MDAVRGCQRVGRCGIVGIPPQRVVQQLNGTLVVVLLFAQYGYLVERTGDEQTVLQVFGNAPGPLGVDHALGEKPLVVELFTPVAPEEIDQSRLSVRPGCEQRAIDAHQVAVGSYAFERG